VIIERCREVDGVKRELIAGESQARRVGESLLCGWAGDADTNAAIPAAVLSLLAQPTMAAAFTSGAVNG
jgi:hypothetical protein